MKKSFTLGTFLMTLSICLVSCYKDRNFGTTFFDPGAKATSFTHSHLNENSVSRCQFTFNNMESAKRAFDDTQKNLSK